jgi:hypothetical protein
MAWATKSGVAVLDRKRTYLPAFAVIIKDILGALWTLMAFEVARG